MLEDGPVLTGKFKMYKAIIYVFSLHDTILKQMLASAEMVAEKQKALGDRLVFSQSVYLVPRYPIRCSERAKG